MASLCSKHSVLSTLTAHTEIPMHCLFSTGLQNGWSKNRAETADEETVVGDLATESGSNLGHHLGEGLLEAAWGTGGGGGGLGGDCEGGGDVAGDSCLFWGIDWGLDWGLGEEGCGGGGA